jgi:glycosyltransferase involved in cell wall biosynthesis
MPTSPRISVVTCSYNQGEYIGRTIDSVLAQDYPNLEHIVVDGMSTDDTVRVLERYPHLKVIREKDRGQADAINKGFRAATGDIWCFLNSDDTFLPGALERVAREIDPARGRHVVMGRCRFIDEHDRFTGIEHPSAFESHRRVLEIWKGHYLPQPAIFWTPEVWRRCGPLNENEQLLLDYDLFCRFSKEYRFHCIDQPLATYRLHAQSKTCSVSDRERLLGSVKVSRRYWGPPTRPLYWQLQLSWVLHRLNRPRRALALLERGRAAWRKWNLPAAALFGAAGALLGPDVLTDVYLLPRLQPRFQRVVRRALRLLRLGGAKGLRPETLAWRDFTALHRDGWVGPTLITTVECGARPSHLELSGQVAFGLKPQQCVLTLFVDGGVVAVELVPQQRRFAVRVPLPPLTAGTHEVKVVARAFAVLDDELYNGDYRPLAFKLDRLELTADGVAQRNAA